jgi:hypothetical protein
MEVDLSNIAEQVPNADPNDFVGEQVIDGFVIYMRIPFINESLGSSTPQVKLDLEKVNQAHGIDLTQFQNTQIDPAQMLQ